MPLGVVPRSATPGRSPGLKSRQRSVTRSKITGTAWRGYYNCSANRFTGPCRKLIAIRFQVFIDATINVRSTTSFCEKHRRTSSNSAQTWTRSERRRRWQTIYNGFWTIGQSELVGLRPCSQMVAFVAEPNPIRGVQAT